jgi:hypothetical protein
MSNTFSLTASQVIEKAFHRLGKASEGEAISARMYEDGLSSLNLLVKSKIGATDRLWLRTEASLSLVSGQASYTLPTTPFPLRITSVRRKSTAGYEVPLTELSREEYFDSPNKTVSPSTPVSFYCDPQRDNAVLYVWPAPDSTAASDYTLNYTYIRRPNDVIQSTDLLDMPDEWLDPVIWMLADDLETEYPVNDARIAQKIGNKAAQGKQMLDYFDTEDASIYIQADLG